MKDIEIVTTHLPDPYKPEETLAVELREIEEHMEELGAQRDVIRAKLMNIMVEQGVRSLKLDSGETYTRAQRSTLKITDPDAAMKFAKRNYALKLDTAKIMKIIRPLLKQPKYFEIVHSEYLRITRRGQKEINGEVEIVE